MPELPCPACDEHTPRHLHETSKDARANFYRCPTCGHIWTVNKLDPFFVVHVTPLPQKPVVELPDPMTARAQCPTCESFSIEAVPPYGGEQVDYFRCLKCLHVWNVPKGADGPVTHNRPVLVPPRK